MKTLVIFLTLLAGANAYSQEYAKIHSLNTHYNIIDKANVEITETYTIEILSKEGKFYSFYRDYIDEFRSVKNVSITIKDKNGNKVKKLKKSDGIELGFSNSYEIDDSKQLIINPEYQLYPFTMEVESTVQLNGFLTLPTWIPRFYFYLSVKQAELTISYPNDMVLKFKEENIDKAEKLLDKENIKHVKYTVSNLPAVNEEMRYREFYNKQPKVLITPLEFVLDETIGSTENWNEFGRWFMELNKQPFELQASTKAFIDSLSDDNTEEKIKHIYNFMQDKTRYISIQLGIGGFKSMPTEEVENYGYGDCKALTTYMKNMLEYAGIKSNYILVNAGRDVPEIKVDFPGNQFNHVFLGVPLNSDTVYLECTSQITPYNYLGTFTDDRPVLWIDEDISKIIKTPGYKSSENMQVNNAIVEVSDNGHAIISIESKNEGSFFDQFTIYEMAPNEYIKKYNQKQFHYRDFTINDFNYKQSDRNDPSFNTNFEIEIRNVTKKLGDRMVIPTNFMAPIEETIDYNKTFNYAEIKRGFTISDSVVVHLPENFWAENLMEDQNIKSEYGNYFLSTEISNKTLIIRRKFKFEKGLYSGDQFAAFNDYLNKLIKIENSKLLLNQKT